MEPTWNQNNSINSKYLSFLLWKILDAFYQNPLDRSESGDCSDCGDENAWTCLTCGAAPPPASQATAIGVATGQRSDSWKRHSQLRSLESFFCWAPFFVIQISWFVQIYFKYQRIVFQMGPLGCRFYTCRFHQEFPWALPLATRSCDPQIWRLDDLWLKQKCTGWFLFDVCKKKKKTWGVSYSHQFLLLVSLLWLLGFVVTVGTCCDLNHPVLRIYYIDDHWCTKKPSTLVLYSVFSPEM